MRKSQALLFSAVALFANGMMVNAALADTVASPMTTKHEPRRDSYEIKEFTSDFREFKIGDIVPDIYRTDPYAISQWQIRHLPAPEADSHWTYMGGNYVLITDAEGKILRAETGDIFY